MRTARRALASLRPAARPAARSAPCARLRASRPAGPPLAAPWPAAVVPRRLARPTGPCRRPSRRRPGCPPPPRFAGCCGPRRLGRARSGGPWARPLPARPLARLGPRSAAASPVGPPRLRPRWAPPPGPPPGAPSPRPPRSGSCPGGCAGLCALAARRSLARLALRRGCGRRSSARRASGRRRSAASRFRLRPGGLKKRSTSTPGPCQGHGKCSGTLDRYPGAEVSSIQGGFPQCVNPPTTIYCVVILTKAHTLGD